MKKYCYICVAAFLQWVLVACTDLQETINNDNPVAAVVHADIASDSYTRTTVDDTGWQVGDAIGVFVTSAGNTTGENVKYVAADTEGNFSSGQPIYFMDGDEAVFSAYYPYIESSKIAADGWMMNDWVIDYTYPDWTMKYDFLFATGAMAGKEAPTVRFTEDGPEADHRFQHKMSMMELKVKTGFQVEGSACNLKYIHLYNLYSRGKINVRTGLTEATGIRDMRILHLSEDLDSEATCRFLVFPQPLVDDRLHLELIVNRQGDEGSTTYATSLSMPDGFASGKKSAYTLVVTDTHIYLESVSVTPWEKYDGGSLDAESGN